ncbi:MAG: hypothetical protein Tsb002_12610 [Wenzhouxiangellaceae bacterium]
MEAAIVTRDPDQTRARILEAAHDLFVAHGMAAVTVRQIAERSGVTKSLIHHYFGSKEGLWNEVKEQTFALYAEQQRAVLASDESAGPELMQRAITHYFKFLQQHPDVVRLFAWTHLEGDSACSRQDGELIKLATERVREAQQRGLFRSDVNPGHAVAVFVIACTQWFESRSHHRHWPGIGSDAEFLEDFLKLFFEGLKPNS